ncbi:MAG TPA: isocitrate lyase/PEP mutase family protein [Methylomirabilota bacterium]|nr:isocitrate lyase/PEP mutase family protein [Methylomirabilota bacterium]
MSRVLDLMAQEGMLVAPGVGDALGALLVVEAGFRAVYMSGYQVSATLGHPDVGLVTMSEMVDRARSIAEAVEVPLITDADTGYGSAVNVTRTVRAFERAGVAGIHLEDQVSPKKCGAMAGRTLVPIPEMTGKIKAALDARRSNDFLIIARTDAIGTEGFEPAIERGQAYRAAGAGAVMVMSPRSREDLARFRKEVDGPLVVTMGSWGFDCPVADLRAIGYGLVFYPVSTMRRAVTVVRQLLRELATTGAMDHSPASMIPMPEMHELLGLARVQRLDARYGA